MIAGLYRPGTSPVHRAPAGAKLLGLAALGTLLFAIPSGALTAAAGALVAALFALAHLSPRLAAGQIRPVLWLLALLFVAQALIVDLPSALLVTGRLAVLILAAGLVTLTTRVTDLVAVLERALAPLRPLGVDPARVSLALSLAIRFVPAIGTVVAEVREAQAARGQERSILTLLVPVIVRLLKMADEIAEAIDARS